MNWKRAKDELPPTGKQVAWWDGEELAVACLWVDGDDGADVRWLTELGHFETVDRDRDYWIELPS